jgi:hypothetical protein
MPSYKKHAQAAFRRGYKDAIHKLQSAHSGASWYTWVPSSREDVRNLLIKAAYEAGYAKGLEVRSLRGFTSALGIVGEQGPELFTPVAGRKFYSWPPPPPPGPRPPDPGRPS